MVSSPTSPVPSANGAFGGTPAPAPGRLIVVEGIEGAGKSTQILLLAQWLRRLGHPVLASPSSSSPIVKTTASRGRRRRIFTPLTYALLHATDVLERVEREVVPSLKAGAIVLTDHYVYAAFARDVVRGLDPHWVRSLYRPAVVPTVAIYFHVPADVAVRRVLSTRPRLKYYDAGLDLGFHDDPVECFREYQTRLLAEYETMLPEFGFTAMDATRPVELLQRHLRNIIHPFVTVAPQEPAYETV